MALVRAWFCAWTLLLIVVANARGETIARCGVGWLETINGYRVLHLKGTPYEMGYQQGALLKKEVAANLHNILEVKGTASVKVGPLSLKPRWAMDYIAAIQEEHVPARYFQELEGLAAGSGMKREDLVAANFLPELFHCSGFAVMKSATADSTLYHGRILDYAVDWGLQEHAVLVIAEPEGGIPFVNVTYAGFIGCVTGMNAEGISLGEMGGGGLGRWDGVPMAILMREALRQAKSIDDVLKVFRDNKRTCQYFYVAADGKTGEAVGFEASWDTFTLVKPGEKHPLLPTPVADAVLLSGGKRYEELVRRVQTGHGRLDAAGALKLMDCPVAAKSNLHSVLFAPKSTKFWVANASLDQKPAAEQPYYEFQLTELLRRAPADDCTVLPLPEQNATQGVRDAKSSPVQSPKSPRRR